MDSTHFALLGQAVWWDQVRFLHGFLNIAQDLDMFGITYFEITNKKGTRLWLGVHNRGMDVYKSTNK